MMQRKRSAIINSNFVDHPAAHDHIAAKAAMDLVQRAVEPLLPAGLLPR